MIFEKLKCPHHGFSFISMPRDGLDFVHQKDENPWTAKCPLVNCLEGILHRRSLEREVEHEES